MYALPPQLIDLICQKVPGIFGPDDEQFERDLAALSPSGFIAKQLIDYPPLCTGGSAPPRPETDEGVEGDPRFTVEDLLNLGVPRSFIDEAFIPANEERESVEQWKWGYAGWLATFSDFRRELNVLREQSADPTSSVPLPSMPNTLAGRHGKLANQDEFFELWRPFFQRWGIDRLATWDLPVPMGPELATPSLDNRADLSAAGIHVFVPWHLLRRKNLEIYAMAESVQFLYLPSGLSKWLHPTAKNWGAKRYIILLRLFIYLELVLYRRYRGRLYRKVGKLDRVFAQVLGDSAEPDQRDDESIRKIRQYMMKRLS